MIISITPIPANATRRRFRGKPLLRLRITDRREGQPDFEARLDLILGREEALNLLRKLQKGLDSLNA